MKCYIADEHIVICFIFQFVYYFVLVEYCFIYYCLFYNSSTDNKEFLYKLELNSFKSVLRRCSNFVSRRTTGPIRRAKGGWTQEEVSNLFISFELLPSCIQKANKKLLSQFFFFFFKKRKHSQTLYNFLRMSCILSFFNCILNMFYFIVQADLFRLWSLLIFILSFNGIGYCVGPK